MAKVETINFAKKALLNELETSAVYSRLAKSYRAESLSERLGVLSETEAEHARFWSRFLEKRGVETKVFRASSLKVVVYTFVFRLLGVGLGLKFLERGERAAINNYCTILYDPELSNEEQSTIRGILIDELRHEELFEEYAASYKFFLKNLAIVLTQISGGLVTVLSVSAGLAGVYRQPFAAAIAGLLVGFTEAMSSAVSFYFYGKTEKQIKIGIMQRLKIITENLPDVFSERMIKFFEKKGLSKGTATMVGEELMQDTNLLRRLFAEERYGIHEEALGDPRRTGLYAGLFRLIGTIFPLIPYFLNLPLVLTVPISVLITLAVLVFTGFLAAISTETSISGKVTELIISGLVLTAVVFFVGWIASFFIQLMQ
ncbi:MAG: VIT1/CCC1 transporter family protein [Candidatus Bathyarchaeia archaeon]|nr:VIT1/CCC1 transporter family protein [Candidatus Bathyarchaeota archaeon]